MRRGALVFAAIAVVPAMIGPLAAQARPQAMIALCGGGLMPVPFDQLPARGEGNNACCAKGCHSGQCRKRPAPAR
ncbi:MAG: hypothetical protein J0I69_15800 [Altererythrobacter sp.]|nr:hypothetical protein [Altererythrobacter sp.]OJU60892.1 MAG: hypothetical protein BGO08_12240 [Altererythrobacter sp. 66-12]